MVNDPLPLMGPLPHAGPCEHHFRCSLGLCFTSSLRGWGVGGSLISTICKCENAEVKQLAQSQSKDLE